MVEPATNCIDEYIRIITKLMDTGYAYFEGGNVYFDTSKLKRYYVFNEHNEEDLAVGVRDGVRCEEWPCIIRAVNTKDAMTATVENIPFDLMQHIVKRIITEVKGVNRVLYDFTPKPTGTIEWE